MQSHFKAKQLKVRFSNGGKNRHQALLGTMKLPY